MLSILGARSCTEYQKVIKKKKSQNHAFLEGHTPRWNRKLGRRPVCRYDVMKLIFMLLPLMLDNCLKKQGMEGEDRQIDGQASRQVMSKQRQGGMGEG